MIKKKEKRRFLIYSMIILIILSYLTVFTFNYWDKILSNYSEKEMLDEEYNNLLSQEDKLNNEVDKLKDDNYVAKYAKEKYMYSTDGEYIIKIVDESK